MAAAKARLILAAVDPELGLHRAFGPVGGAVVAERGALTRDPEPERAPDRPHERAELLLCQFVAGSERVELRPPERLVRVVVPDAGEEALVEDERLPRRAPAGDPVGERSCRERPAERLCPDALGQVRLELARLEKQPRTEAADVPVGDVRSVV